MTKAVSTAKSFLLYKDFHDQLQELTVEQAGHLIKAVFAHHADDDYPLSDPVVKFALKGMVSQFKRDSVKYKETCVKRSAAGKLGAKQKLANAGKRKHKLAKQADRDSDTDRDTESDREKKKMEIEASEARFQEKMKILRNNQSMNNAVEAVFASHAGFDRIARTKIENIIKGYEDRGHWVDAIEGMARKWAGVKMPNPAQQLVNWLDGKPSTTGKATI